ncbi:MULTISPECIES: (2Fe-2S)-binding protein [Desulfosediminicola]|uniref:(2Fe-2S)-binding protein n=1 Tax=Desulfosediminicola TaxID=2886823 RepID=UPI001C3D6BE0|nr:2Fe-2S iron-sulfur cluster-binding protein [Desulfosediminicola ganghwensis]
MLLDGEAIRSCSITLEDAKDSEIITIEGLADEHPVKLAWLEKQVPQCGYCQPGIMLQTVDFLSRQPSPTDQQINEQMDDVYCRCGSHPRIKEAIHMAADLSKKQGG